MHFFGYTRLGVLASVSSASDEDADRTSVSVVGIVAIMLSAVFTSLVREQLHTHGTRLIQPQLTYTGMAISLVKFLGEPQSVSILELCSLMTLLGAPTAAFLLPTLLISPVGFRNLVMRRFPSSLFLMEKFE